MNGTEQLPTPDDPRDLLGAWALDAVDDTERREVERLLEADPDARAEADRLVAAAGHLGDAATQDERAPAGLLDSIMGQLDGPRTGRNGAPPTPTLPTSPTAPGAGPGAVPPATADPASTVAGLTELERRRARRSRGSRAPWLLSAAAVVVLVVVGAVVVAVRDGGSSDPTLEEVAAEAAGQPGSRSADLVTEDRIVAAQVVVDTEGHGYVTVHDMPATDDAHTYQLWSVDGGTPISLGLFDGSSPIAVVGVDAGVTQLAVTLEPAGGSADPTTAPMASGELAVA